MQDLHAAVGDQRLLGFVDPDAVRRAQARGRKSGALQILDVAGAARQPSHDFDFITRLRGVRVHEHVMLRGERGDRFEQLAGAGDREARRERDTQPAARGAMPPPVQGEAFIHRWLQALVEALWCLAGRVHHAFPDRRPRPHAASSSSTASVSCTVSIVSTVVVPERSSSAAASWVAARSVAAVWAASSGQTRSRSQSSSGRSSANAKERLAQMDVRLHEPRQDVGAADVDHVIR